MAKIIWAKSAFEDLNLISDFIAKDSEYYAAKVIEKIKRRTLILKDHQRIGRPLPDFPGGHIREIFEYNYRIVYQIISDKEVAILRVHHQSQILPPL